MKQIEFISAFAVRFMILCSALVLGGCAHREVKPSGGEQVSVEGQWEASATLREVKTKRLQAVTLQILVQKPGNLKMEVIGPVGTPLAVLALQQDKISYLILAERRFFSGPITERSLRPLLAVDLDPRWLLDIVMDREIQGPGWSCSLDEAKRPEKCQRGSALTIQVRERNGLQRRAIVQTDAYELQVFFRTHSPKVEFAPGSFSLAPPEGFDRFRLR